MGWIKITFDLRGSFRDPRANRQQRAFGLISSLQFFGRCGVLARGTENFGFGFLGKLYADSWRVLLRHMHPFKPLITLHQRRAMSVSYLEIIQLSASSVPLSNQDLLAMF